MAGRIDNTLKNSTAAYVSCIMSRDHKDWVYKFSNDRFMGLAELCEKYSVTNELWTFADGGNPAHFNQWLELYSSAVTGRDHCVAVRIFSLSIYFNMSKKYTLGTMLLMAGLICALKCYNDQNEEDEKLLERIIRDIESVNGDLTQVFNRTAQAGYHELYCMMYVILYMKDYEGFREIAKEALLDRCLVEMTPSEFSSIQKLWANA